MWNWYSLDRITRRLENCKINKDIINDSDDSSADNTNNKLTRLEKFSKRRNYDSL